MLGFLLALTVTVACVGFVPLRVTCVGEMLHEVSEGAPAQVSETLPVNPLSGVRINV